MLPAALVSPRVVRNSDFGARVIFETMPRASYHQTCTGIAGSRGVPCPAMSALGQKRTLRPFHPMSALPPKADVPEDDVTCVLEGGGLMQRPPIQGRTQHVGLGAELSG